MRFLMGGIIMDFKDELKRVRKHGAVKSATTRRKVYPEFADCEKCGGTLYKADGTICSCYRMNQIYNKLRAANVGNRYFDVTLDFYTKHLHSCSVIMYNGFKSGSSNNTFGIEDFVEFVDNYVHTFDKRAVDGRGFIISGNTGCGKTGAVCYIIREVLMQGKSAYYIDTNDLLETIDISWNGDEEEKSIARKKLKNLDEVDLLVLDDIGSEYSKNKDWLYNQFLKRIKKRYSFNRPTIMTTNLTPEKIMSGFDEGVVGRLSSVLSEFQVIYMQNAKDVRVVKGSKSSLRKDMSRETKGE